MEDKMNRLNDSELEQVTGGKSSAEWRAYFDSISTVSPEEKKKLMQKALNEIRNDPDLSAAAKKQLERQAGILLGVDIKQIL